MVSRQEQRLWMIESGMKKIDDRKRHMNEI